MSTPDPAAPPAPPAPPTDPPAKAFTQDDVNRLLADEKRRLLAEQPDLTELRNKAKQFDDLQAASQTELERERARADAAEKAATAANAAKNEALRRSAVTAAATRAGAVDPDAVFALLDPSKVTVGDDGLVTGVDDAVKALLDDKKYLVGTPTPPPAPPKPAPGSADGGPQGTPAPGQLTREDITRLSAEGRHAEITQAKAEGRLNDVLGITK